MRPNRRRALLIGTENYEHYLPLRSTQADLRQLGQVLGHTEIGHFDEVRVLADLTADQMHQEVADFLGSSQPNETSLVYITGHGIRLHETSEFYFVAQDTDPNQISQTAMSASFLNEQLEQCVAPQKVAILDCCYSAGMTIGFKTRAEKSAEPLNVRGTPITSRGVFVLASSGAGEISYAGEVSATDVKPSVFTEELVRGLHTGEADRDEDGLIALDELFDYVCERIRSRKLPKVQSPHKSSLGVTDKLELAKNCKGRALTFPVVQPMRSTAPLKTKSDKTSQNWKQLLEYYQQCILADNETAKWFSPKDKEKEFVCLTGKEQVIAGDLDEFGRIPVPPETKKLIEDSDPLKHGFWCGYPVVALREKTTKETQLAPLLMRRVDVVDIDGQSYLEPYGEAVPHLKLCEKKLSEDDTAALLSTFRSEWQPGVHTQMLKSIRNLLIDELAIGDVEPLRPLELSENIDLRSPNDGARNAAIFFRTPQENSSTNGLLKELKKLIEQPQKIAGTALESLFTGMGNQVVGADFQSVAPMLANEGQNTVIKSAMTKRLTVATGPPGTGKSQLVVNLCATAVGNGQKVLVASTNNTAVDEVWERCEKLVPGAIVRTGNSDAKTKERDSLAALARLRGGRNQRAAWEELRIAAQASMRFQQILADIAGTEITLTKAGIAREETAKRLGLTVTQLALGLAAGNGVIANSRKATQLANTRLFGAWRRRRWLKSIGLNLEPSSSVCFDLAVFGNAEAQWQAGRQRLNSQPDSTITDHGKQVAEHYRQKSQEYLAATIARNAEKGSRRIAALIQAQAVGNRGDWNEIRDVLPYISGWAVTNLSIRRFPSDPALFDLVIIDEASQCSIPSMIPLLYRAKRALIIGDPMQLPHIATVTPQHEAKFRRDARLDPVWLEKQRLTYNRHSSYHAAEQAVGEPLLLAEHYRCHPRIVEFSNYNFYGGRLKILTDVRQQRRAKRPAFSWVNVTGKVKQTEHGWQNSDEVKRTKDIVETLLRELPPEATIGVVTALTAQKKALEKACKNYTRVRIGTVHTFQGGECDAVVFSLIATKELPKKTLGWLERQSFLWNVAVTRARAHLVVVGDQEFWRKRGGIGAALLNATEDTGAFDSDDDPLISRLYQKVHAIPDADIELDAVVNGYPADGILNYANQPRAILLDRGIDTELLEEQSAPSSLALAEHLRLQQARTRLLSSVEQPAIRIPAWRLYDETFDLTR